MLVMAWACLVPVLVGGYGAFVMMWASHRCCTAHMWPFSCKLSFAPKSRCGCRLNFWHVHFACSSTFISVCVHAQACVGAQHCATSHDSDRRQGRARAFSQVNQPKRALTVMLGVSTQSQTSHVIPGAHCLCIYRLQGCSRMPSRCILVAGCKLTYLKPLTQDGVFGSPMHLDAVMTALWDLPGVRPSESHVWANMRPCRASPRECIGLSSATASSAPASAMLSPARQSSTGQGRAAPNSGSCASLCHTIAKHATV